MAISSMSAVETSQTYELLHQGVPGRLRVRVLAIYRDDSLAIELEAQLQQVHHLTSVRSNSLTGTILLQFDAGKLTERQVLQQLEIILAGIQKLTVFQGSLQTIRHRSHRSRSKTDRGNNGLGFGALRQLVRPSSDSLKRRRPAPTTPHIVGTESIDQAPWYALPVDSVLERIGSRESGLVNSEASNRLQKYGSNRLDEQKQRPPYKIIMDQLLSIPVGMLGVSAVVSLATGGVADALVIAGVVVINAAIGYFTESAAEKTINALGTLTPEHVWVLREGVRTEIPMVDVVIGDLLLLAPGSYIPADARLISNNNLTVDESALTGESLPVVKDNRETELDTPLGERSNMVHMGTIVTGGSGTAVVTASGKYTEIGQIQSMVGEVSPPETPMQRELDQIGVKLATLSAGICTLVFGIGIFRGLGWLPMLSSSISLAVAAVPEGLPAVATTTLALGIRQMKKQKVLIRQLPAVEALGSVQTICLDKTGTLTMNQMKVVTVNTHRHAVELRNGEFILEGETYPISDQQDMNRLLEVVSLCSEVQLSQDLGIDGLEGSPTECALVEAAIHAGHDVSALRLRLPLINMEHRAEDRPYMFSTHQETDDLFFLGVKGSPSEVIELCAYYQVGEERLPLDKKTKKKILAQNEQMAGEALRVLGVAYGYSQSVDSSIPSDLIWLGLIGMEDILRPGMRELMAQFHDAGIDTVMITGDQCATAASVGRRLGLSRTGDIQVVDAKLLDQADTEELSRLVKGTTIFARVSPAHKLRIVQAMQANGRVVAMTGDGINDGPALKAADVGVAMGDQGTDVARSVASVVLQDDNMHTMITAVEQGRTIYGNIRKSLRFLLSSNLSEIQIMLASFALGYGEALNPMQLLWINLVTDIFPALALSMDPPEKEVLKQAPRDPQKPILGREDIVSLLRESMTMTAGSLAVFAYSISRYGVGGRASTNTFMALTMAQFLQSITSRSETTSILDRDRPANPYLNLAIAGSFGAQALAVLFPPLRGLLRLTPITMLDLAIVMAGSAVPFVINEGAKTLNARPIKQLN